MLFSLSPVAFAIVRVLQWIALGGFSCVVIPITSWTRAGVIVLGFPDRGASFSSAAMPPRRYRLRHRAAFSGIIFSWEAICRFCLPAAAINTIRVRSTLRAGALRARANVCRAARQSGSRTIGGAVRIGIQISSSL